MGFARAEIEIGKPPDDVWAVAGDFGGIAEWMPGVESCIVDGDDRIVKMLDMQITERLQSRDEEARVLVYGIVGGIPVGNHRVTITVSETRSGSLVVFEVEIEPDDMTDLMRHTYEGALKALKDHLDV
ncbi:MAG: SRPBCC family protein [Acidimicrobiales bacterium]|jgi:carbon monoxide dehydrogenase subunit G